MSYRILYVLFVFFYSCNPLLDNIIEEKDYALRFQDSLSSNVNLRYQQTPYFDWESNNYIHYNCGEKDVPLPWFVSFTSIPGYIANDHRKVDGWDLMYNTFYTPGDEYPILIFYNKYRGLLRFYYYHVNNHNGNGLFFALQNTGDFAESSIFNFSKSIVFPTDNRQYKSYIQKMNFTELGPSGPSKGHWYSCDFDVSSYDKSLIGQSSSNQELSFYIWQEDVSDVKIDGKSVGSIKGDISISGSGSSLLSMGSLNLGGIANSNSSINTSFSVGGVENIKQTLLQLASKQIKSSLAKAAGDAAGAMATGGFSLITSPISKMISSFIGTSASPGSVNLNVNTNISMAGTIRKTSPILQGRRFIIPGTIPSGQTGLLPSSDIKSIGVYSIDGSPVVDVDMSEDLTNSILYHSLTLDESSFSVNMNPDLLSSIDGFDVKYYIYFMKTYTGPDFNIDSYHHMGAIIDDSQCVNSDPENYWYITNDFHFKAPYSRNRLMDKNIVVRVDVSIYPKGSDVVTHSRFVVPKMRLNSFNSFGKKPGPGGFDPDEDYLY